MFGERLRKLRLERRMTMKEFGERFKLAESTISGYENGVRTPDVNIMMSFADFFDVSVDYLLGRTDVPKEKHKADYTDSEQQFLRDIETLSLEQLAERYNLQIGGREATKEEMEEAVRYIKARRIMNAIE